MRIEQTPQLDFGDVMIRPMRSSLDSRIQVDITRQFKFPNSNVEWSGVPIVFANMDKIGTLEMFKETVYFKIVTALHKFYAPDEITSFFKAKYNELFQKVGEKWPGYVAYSLGMRQQDMEHFDALYSSGFFHWGCDFIVIDVPNGYIDSFIEFCRSIREKLPYHIIMAGNVVTPDITTDLIRRGGVDIVKVGLGSGGVCTTRAVTGVGRPQLSAVMDCSDYAHQIKGMVCSDGGIREIGDFSKAFVGGADFVMAGSIFAPYSPNNEKFSEHSEVRVVKFHGMSSEEAMIEHYGEVAEHRAPEGKAVEVAWKGPISGFMKQVFGGIRSTGTYIGSIKLKDFSKNGSFYLVHNQLNNIFK